MRREVSDEIWTVRLFHCSHGRRRQGYGRPWPWGLR